MFYGALLLTGANLVLRLVSMSFQVYLSGRVGAAGVGLLQLVLSVKMLSFTIGSAGARTCALYLSAEALGRRRSVRPALRGCGRYCLLFSLPTAAGLWLLTPRIAGGWIGDAAGEAALRAFALFLPVTCLNGVMTGLYTAAGRLRTLVAVEFWEQGCAIAVTFALLSRWADMDDKKLFATSVAIILPICLVSTAVYFSQTGLSLLTALPYLIGGAAGGLAGALSFQKIPVKWLKLLFAGFLLYGGVRYLL